MDAKDPATGRRFAILALVLLAVAAAALLIVLISDGSVANPILVAVLTAAALAGVAAWVNERATARRHAALEEKRRGEMAARAKELESQATRSNGDLEDLRRQVEAQREDLTKERQLRLRTERARRAEREWTRELREQVMTMYRRNGHSGDPRELVLEIAIQLSGAEKGVLLSQHDGDGGRQARPRLPSRLRARPRRQLADPALRRPGDRARRDHPRGRSRRGRGGGRHRDRQRGRDPRLHAATTSRA